MPLGRADTQTGDPCINQSSKRFRLEVPHCPVHLIGAEQPDRTAIVGHRATIVATSPTIVALRPLLRWRWAAAEPVRRTVSSEAKGDDFLSADGDADALPECIAGVRSR